MQLSAKCHMEGKIFSPFWTGEDGVQSQLWCISWPTEWQNFLTVQMNWTGYWRLLTSAIYSHEAARWFVRSFWEEKLFIPLKSISEWGQDLSGRSCPSCYPLSCACSVSIPGILSPGPCCCRPLESHVPIHYHFSLKRTKWKWQLLLSPWLKSTQQRVKWCF